MEWKKKSMSFLRRIAKELNLNKGDYSIRFNPGGIAVSGDAILHHNSFYLHINDFGGYWRTCKGQKDYSGGANRNFNTGNTWGANLTESELIAQIRGEVFPTGFTHGTQGGAGDRPWEAGKSFDSLPDAYPRKKIQSQINQIKSELREIAANNPDLDPETETLDEALENELEELESKLIASV